MLRHLITLFLSCSSVTSEILNLREGSTCMRNGVSGKCVNVYNCLSSYLDFMNKDYAPICSFQGKEPILCCTDCNFYDTRNILINENVGILRKTGQKAEDSIKVGSKRLKNLRFDDDKILFSPKPLELQTILQELSRASLRLGLTMNRSKTQLMTNSTKRRVEVDFVKECIEYIHSLDYSCKAGHYARMTRIYKPDTNCNEVNFDDVQFAAAGYGGTDASREEFPHMALLGYGDNIETADWFCGGSVISERFILTAGHCLSSPNLGPVKYVTLGILKRSDPPELWQIYNVKRRIPHPEYKPPSKYHDIALLETDTEIIFSSNVLPACVHATGEAEKYLFATGWGTLGYRKELADTLQEIPVTRYEQDDCSKYYPPHRLLKNGFNHTTQMCYGDKEVLRDTCEGDSGGPLQDFRNKYSEILYCIKTVVGVTSYGRKCGISNSPGIYTRVIHYIPWIESIVWP